MDGIELGARFSLATNRLAYCGPSDAEGALYRVLTGPGGRPEARAALSRFEALVPYLEAIGAHHGRDPFDHDVVEAYWLGNRLLDGFTREDFKGILAGLVRRGLPRSIAGRLQARLPPAPPPHHLFHVSFVGVGEVTGHVASTLENMEACRPAWARVAQIDGSTLTLERSTLAVLDGRFVEGASRVEERPYDPKALPDLRVDDPVVMHWGWPALRPSSEQLALLRRYSLRALEAANAARAGLRPGLGADSGSPR